ncbi:F-box/kelch-repeat protein At3g06240-like [Arachis duranensis]|uniref:F-box/kelch-repeat protein At3g06240-like n=1 Tax=Arachis duranensis TaxID=130453 RepID=A0A9C6WSU8_ARADU|nr:F-box/kelch-repeat protein At3g06240-like [Arachis duranensis]
MEEKKLKSFNDLLPPELIRAILLRVPIKHLACVRCVSKLWNTLISDPNFAKSHLDLSLAPSHTCLFLQDNSHAYSVDLDALLQDDNDGVDAIALSLPFMKKPPSDFHLLGSCRGVYDRLVKVFCFLHDALLYGFGYDASQDDYVIVVAYKGKDGENHFNMCYLRSNSWISLDAALPKSSSWDNWKPKGLFCNGAIHWSTYEYCIDILIFDLKERSFSTICGQHLFKPRVVLLGGCLAFYLYGENTAGENTTEVWVMKEYKVESSWTVYEIPLELFKPLCLSANGDIIGRCYPSDGEVGFYIYNVRGELLKHVQYLYGEPSNHIRSIVHVDCLMAVPSNIKKKKRKKGM